MRALVLPEELKKLLGVLPDTQLAARFKVAENTVRAHRRLLGVASPCAKAAPYAWGDSALALLGKDSDAAVARRLGIATDTVMRKRRALGIPSFGKSGVKTRWSQWMLGMLGKHPDRVIAKQFGIGVKTVGLMRRSQQIAPQRGETPQVDWASKNLDLLKTMGTTALSKAWGVSYSAVSNLRRELSIPAPPIKGRAIWSPAMESVLGTDFDIVVAQRLGLSFAQVIGRCRKLKIAGFRRMWREEDAKVLGTVKDADAARILGISPIAAAKKRIKLGIPAYAKARWTKAVLDLIGKRPDEEIAPLCGRRPNTVRDRRIAMGIKACPRDSRPPGTLSCSDIAAEYGVTMRRVQAWRNAGLPCQRAGHMIVVQQSDLARWIAHNGLKKSPARVQAPRQDETPARGMTEAELRGLAARLGVPVQEVARWHLVHGQHFKANRRGGRPKGKPKRRKGMLSVMDARKKYNVTGHTLSRWRATGLPHRIVGTMTLMKDADLARWIETLKSKREATQAI